MTDLNAPLQPKRPLSPPRAAPAAVGQRSTKRPLIWPFALVSIIVTAANGFAFMPDPPALDSRPIQLIQPTVAVAKQQPVVDNQPAAQEPTHGVQVVYGTPGTANEIAPAPAADQTMSQPEQQPGGTEDDRLLSPGGPKIITLRRPETMGIGQPPEIAHLPDEAALEDTAIGFLPQRTEDGRAPMDIYARPWSGAGGKRIAMVIGGIGLSQTGTQRALDALPPEITLGFAPEGNSLNRWMRVARKKGHELVLQVPMEPFGYPEINPGAATLRLASSPEANIERLHSSMVQLTNYTGIMNYLGGRIATDQPAMRPIMAELALRGLLFVNDGTVTATLGSLAANTGVPYAQADIVVDTSRNEADMRAQFKALEELATARGYAVGSGSALELTVSEVSRWANDAKKRGFEFVGISAIARENR